jgi:hypothetical protein
MGGIAFLKGIGKKLGVLQFILFTGRGGEEIEIKAINNGAYFLFIHKKISLSGKLRQRGLLLN